MTRTVYLGQFEHENAEAIAERLEHAGIAWYHKEAGRFVQRLFLGEWGVRLYVDADRLADAERIAREVVAD